MVRFKRKLGTLPLDHLWAYHAVHSLSPSSFSFSFFLILPTMCEHWTSIGHRPAAEVTGLLYFACLPLQQLSQPAVSLQLVMGWLTPSSRSMDETSGSHSFLIRLAARFCCLDAVSLFYSIAFLKIQISIS